MNFNQAIERAERYIYNEKRTERLEALKKAQVAMEPYRKYKRLNSTHCKEISQSIEGHISVRLLPHRWNAGMYELLVHYREMYWDENASEPHINNLAEHITFERHELSGESICQRLTQVIEQVYSYYKETEDISVYKAFFRAIDAICVQYSEVSERALQFLTKR